MPGEAASHLFQVITRRYERGSLKGDSYRMRGHRARLQTLRTALNQPSQGGEFVITSGEIS